MVRITMEDGGIIDIELNEEAAPITCENFIRTHAERREKGSDFFAVLMRCKRAVEEHCIGRNESAAAADKAVFAPWQNDIAL